MPDDDDEGRIHRMREAIHHAVVDTTDTTPEPLASSAIGHIARLGMENPEALSPEQVQKLCASVMAHVETHG